MRIVTPTEIEHVAWDGYLEPVNKLYKGAETEARVTLAAPKWWRAAQAMENELDKKWTPPADGRDYTLVELTCTFHPPNEPGSRYTAATLTAYLRPRYGAGRVTAYDLYPRRLTAEAKSVFTVALGPELKFAQMVEASLLAVGAEIEYRRAFPVIQAFDAGKSAPYWQFAHHAAHPLLGCQSVYLVTAAPPDAGGVRLSVELLATVETRFGPVRLGLPEDEHAYISSLIA